MLLRLHLFQPRCESVLAIRVIDDSFMESLSQALFVHPVVLDTRLNILQVYLFTELLHFLKLIFAEYAQKCSGSHVEKLTIG